MKGKSLKSFIGMGAIALAVMLIVLTIACFAVLTYVSADSEYRISEKSQTAVDTYYKADTTANETLQKISSAIKNGNLQDFATKKGYNVTRTAGNDIIAFQVPMENQKSLQAKVAFSSPEKWKILKWEITIDSRAGKE